MSSCGIFACVSRDRFCKCNERCNGMSQCYNINVAHVGIYSNVGM